MKKIIFAASILLSISSVATARLLNDRTSCEEIYSAAWVGKYSHVHTLLKDGVDPNCEYDNKSILLGASRFGKSWQWDQNLDTVKILVEYGADINFEYVSSETNTPTYIAAAAGHTETALYLVSMGGNLDEAEKGHLEYIAKEKGSLLPWDILNRLTGGNNISDSLISDKKEKWDLSTINQDVAYNQFIVGVRYLKGKGREQNYRLALRWLTKSAKRGDDEAGYWLGRMYEEGLGVKENQMTALNWYQKSAVNGNSYSQSKIAGYFIDNHDYENALIWYKKSAEQGSATSQHMAGALYQNAGKNEKARYWYKKAASQGHEDAKRSLLGLSKKWFEF